VNANTSPEAQALATLEPGHDRSKFLGGSDIAAVMGLSPWATPVELWMQKTGRTPKEEPDAARQRMFDRGHKLEPFIRDMVIAKLQDLGVEVKLLAVNQRYQDAQHPFLACEIDFELELTGEVEIGGTVYAMEREPVNADAKSVSGFARKKWGMDSNEDVPIEYAAQFMHGLGIRGRRFCLVAALRSFDDVDIYWTVRDDDTIAGIRDKAVQFWNECVLADVAPDPFTFSDIKLLFPVDNGKAIEATEEIAQKVSDLRRVKAAIKDLEEQETMLTFDIGEFISPNSALKFSGQEICTWKAQATTRLDQKRLKEELPDICKKYSSTTTGRVLRLKKPGA
jgi:predicted phage-related endonuclease